MTKKYISDSDIAFNLSIEGKRVHISFDPQYRGGSVYLATSRDIQEAMEGHSDYGVLFRLSADEPTDGHEVDEISALSNVDTEGYVGGHEVIESVTTCQEAKDILKERGVSAANMKNKAMLLDIAASMNIQFINLK